MHGAGHNAGMGHSDDRYNGSLYGEQTPQNAMIMGSGRFFQRSAGMQNTFGKKNNSYYIKQMQNTFGTTRSDNYIKNKNATNRR